MLKKYLDERLYQLIIKNFSFNEINEIRMRVNQRLVITIRNKKFFLKDENNDYVIVKRDDIDRFIERATEHSIYAYNDSIVNGYVTLPNGIRVGLSGYVVRNKDNITTIKEFQSLNIRIPHIVKNCSLKLYDFLVDDELKYNTLILSPPGAGKTTMLRDFVMQLNAHNVSKNVLLVDERNEISGVLNGNPTLDMGCFCDIYTNCSKEFAFTNGIRSMAPDIIITDEIDINKDLECIINAINSGVKVIATIHAKDIEELKKKNKFFEILNNKFFHRYVVLSNQNGPGVLSNIYDENLNLIYCG